MTADSISETSMFKPTKSFVILIVLVIFVAIVGICVYSEMNMSKKPWSVVYLSSGDIYVAKVSHFPKMWISSDAYLLQVVKATVETEEGTPKTETNFQLTPIREALWAPEKLYLNQDQIIFYGPISETSQVAETLREANK